MKLIALANAPVQANWQARPLALCTCSIPAFAASASMPRDARRSLQRTQRAELGCVLVVSCISRFTVSSRVLTLCLRRDNAAELPRHQQRLSRQLSPWSNRYFDWPRARANGANSCRSAKARFDRLLDGDACSQVCSVCRNERRVWA